MLYPNWVSTISDVSLEWISLTTDLFEYINDNNVDGFTQYVDQTFDEE